MPIEYTGKNAETVVINPDDTRGPWTIKFPLNARHNDVLTIKTNRISVTPVTVDSQSALVVIENPYASNDTGSTWEFVSAGKVAFTWRYSKPRQIWILTNSHLNTSAIGVAMYSAAEMTPLINTPTTITNWNNGTAHQFFDYITPPNKTTGVITIPLDGTYIASAQLLFVQGSNVKNIDSELFLQRSIQGDLLVDAMPIASQTTDYRTLRVYAYGTFTAGEQITLGMTATGDLGLVTFIASTWSLDLAFIDRPAI